MDADFLTRLGQATTEAEREWLLLEMTMGQLSAEVETAVWATAIPHWFDILYLAAILDDPQLDSLDQISSLSFIEQYPGRGFNMHERSRRYFLDNLWQKNPEQFRLYSARAAAYCAGQNLSKPEWRVEQIYHLLISDPQQGSSLLREWGMAWQNFPYNDYEQVEALARVALEHRDAGRLAVQNENWALYWQAHIDMLYGRDAVAVDSLAQMQVEAGQDLTLIALRNHAKGDIYRRQGDSADAVEAYLAAFAAYSELGQTLNAAIVQAAINELTAVGNETVTHEAAIPKVILQPIEKSPPLEEEPVGRLSDEQKIRQTLLDNVKTAWLDGVLQQAVPYELTLDMQAEAGLVSPAAAMTLHVPGQMDQQLPHNVPLLDVFIQSGRSLLILGAPASGKTIALLQLTRQLHARALADPQVPLPLVFNLSSWGQKRGSLLAWLANEAHLQYQVGRKYARETLLPQGNLTLLLDGLDEVPLAAREACVDAINEFLAQYNHDVVVCSRIGDYEALQSRLKLAHAIVLQPLTNQQIRTFIKQVAAEDQREALLVQVAAERPLREALRSPLLLNMYSQAFAEMTAVADTTGGDSVAARRENIFAAYVDTAVAQSEETDKVDFQAQSKQWLAFLAKGMQQASTTLFFVEELQPTWLPPHLLRRYRTFYGAFFGLILGLLYALSIGVVSGLFLGVSSGISSGIILGLAVLLLSGVLIGLIGALEGAVALWLTTNIRHKWLRATIGGAIIWLSLGWGYGLLLGWLNGQLGSLLFLFGMIISIGMGCLTFDIQLREQVKILRPTSQRMLKYVKRGVFFLFVGLIAGLVLVLADGLYGWQSRLGTGLFFGLLVGLMGGFVGGALFAFLDTPPVNNRPHPAGGVRASLRNAFLITLVTIIFFIAVAWLISQILNENDSIILAVVLLNILLITFTWFGGLAWCQHWTLRFVFARQDFLPWRLVPWLNEMVALGLLRRVGGGYIFIHRGLLEYFAGEVATDTSASSAKD